MLRCNMTLFWTFLIAKYNRIRVSYRMCLIQFANFILQQWYTTIMFDMNYISYSRVFSFCPRLRFSRRGL